MNLLPYAEGLVLQSEEFECVPQSGATLGAIIVHIALLSNILLDPSHRQLHFCSSRHNRK